jgi:large subunit ribosomal protein L22
MTEKNYAPDTKEKKIMKKQTDKVSLPKVKEESKIVKAEEKKIESNASEKKKVIEKKKLDYACVNVKGIVISTKMGAYICKFIKKKKIDEAIKYLEGTIKGKNVIPMKGEIAHRHGEFMAGRYPVNASKEFIILLKSLKSNAIQNGIENPVITEAVANMGSRPLGRGGRVQRKRTHITLVAKEIKILTKKK